MKGDYGNLSVRGAREQLQAIYGAKDFLRGSQMECPDMFGHYQKQIDELTQDEDELNSWLGENGDYGEDYDFEGGYDDAVVQEDLAHFNDDLYEDGRASLPDYLKPWYGMTADSFGPVIDSSEASLYNQNGGTNSADEDITRKIYESWYEDDEPGCPSPAPDSKDQAPLTGRIDTDPDSGAGMWYAPDGSGTSIDDFQAADNEDESDKVDSKTAWEIISDWVKADDGGINNGSFQTDPESGRTYYVSPDGMLTPITAFGVNDGEVQGAQGESETAPQTGQIYTDPDSGESYHIAPDGTATPMSEVENPTAEETESELSILEKLGAALLGKDTGGYGYAETDPETGITHYADPNKKLAPLITYDDE